MKKHLGPSYLPRLLLLILLGLAACKNEEDLPVADPNTGTNPPVEGTRYVDPIFTQVS